MAPSKTYVMLLVVEKDLDPDELTKLLKVKPTRSHRRGDPFRPGDRPATRAYGAWSFSTEGLLESSELPDHASKLLAAIEPAKSALLDYRQKSKASVSIILWWEPNERPTEVNFPSSQLARLAELCEDLHFYYE